MPGTPMHLTPIEYRLLVALIERAGQVVTHSELLKAGWATASSISNITFVST